MKTPRGGLHDSQHLSCCLSHSFAERSTSAGVGTEYRKDNGQKGRAGIAGGHVGGVLLVAANLQSVRYWELGGKYIGRETGTRQDVFLPDSWEHPLGYEMGIMDRAYLG